MFAFLPLAAVVLMPLITFAIHALSGFAHADDSWTERDYANYYARFER